MKRRDIKVGDEFGLKHKRSPINGHRALPVTVENINYVSPNNITYDVSDGHSLYMGVRASDLMNK